MSVVGVEVKSNKIVFAWDTRLTYADFPYEMDKVFKINNIIIGRSGEVKNESFIKRYVEETSKKIIFFESAFEVQMYLEEYKKRFEGIQAANFSDGDSMYISDSRKVYYLHNINNTCIEIKPGSFDALGSGANYAIGAYKASKDIKQAIEIACECNIYCGLPIKTLEVDII